MFRRLFDVAIDRTGAALVEFTILLPVLLLLIMGLIQFGMIFYDYIMVTNAAAVGARQFAISRLDTTPATDTLNVINNSSAQLNGLSISLSVNNQAACSTNTSINNQTCQTQLQTAFSTGNPASPEPVSVTVSYPCNGVMLDFLFNMSGICPLTSKMEQPVQ
jgi:Flp pilus assembly protein TadG